MTTEVIMENQLEVIVKGSCLESTKANHILTQFKDYFDIAAEWEQRAKTIVVTDGSQQVDMQMARTGRLFLREKRVAIEKARKHLKEQSLREGKAIDGIANVLKALIVPLEEYLDRQEHFVEIKAAAKAEQESLEAERKAEEERLENEKLDNLAEDRFNEAVFYRQFWRAETYAFRGMSQDEFDLLMVDLVTIKTEYEAEQARIRIENERLKTEADEQRKREEAEREKHEEELRKEREAKAKAEAEKIAAEEKARAEKRAAAEKARKEKERQEKALADQKAQAAAEKKAAEDRAKAEQARQEKVIADQKAKVKAEREEKERLAKLIKKVECPKCHYLFEVVIGDRPIKTGGKE